MGKRAGRPSFSAEMRRLTVEKRFWSKVAVSEVEGACWFWGGSLTGPGYGHMTIWKNGKWVTGSAHRLAYTLAHGEIPGNLVVMHKCGNKNCVNPNHLTLGTHKENSEDAARAGAYKQAKLREGGKAKLAAQMLVAGVPAYKIAMQMGASDAAIRQIKDGISYRKEMKEAIEELTQTKIASPPAKVELTIS